MFLAAFCTVSAQTNIAQTDAKSIKLDTSGIPMGILGFPVGSYLTIEGVKDEVIHQTGEYLRVDTVNGNKLTKPVFIEWTPITSYLSPTVHWTNNVDVRGWPKGERFIIKGYEKMKMNGIPPGLVEAAKESGQNTFAGLAPGQGPFGGLNVGWDVQHLFVVTSIVSPTKEQH